MFNKKYEEKEKTQTINYREEGRILYLVIYMGSRFINSLFPRILLYFYTKVHLEDIISANAVQLSHKPFHGRWHNAWGYNLPQSLSTNWCWSLQKVKKQKGSWTSSAGAESYIMPPAEHSQTPLQLMSQPGFYHRRIFCGVMRCILAHWFCLIPSLTLESVWKVLGSPWGIFYLLFE